MKIEEVEKYEAKWYGVFVCAYMGKNCQSEVYGKANIAQWRI